PPARAPVPLPHPARPASGSPTDTARGCLDRLRAWQSADRSSAAPSGWLWPAARLQPRAGPSREVGGHRRGPRFHGILPAGTTGFLSIMYRIGFDVGGTFTDFTLHDVASGALHHFKVPTSPADPSEGIADGLNALLSRHGIAPQEISFAGHGTTIATNMVIERRGVRTGLITTQGFRDVLEIGRQTRPHLYDYTVRTPPPLVPRAYRLEVRERLDAAGAVLHPLDEATVAEAADALGRNGVQAVAICFLHAYLDGTHEQRAAEIVRSRLPGVYVSTSFDILPEFREYERFSTTVINATIGPRMADYLARLLDRLAGLGMTAPPHTIHSNGGLMSVETVRRYPVRTCLSGPAAGVVGAAQVAREAGFPDAITFDVGGTSTDVSLVENGVPAFAT